MYDYVKTIKILFQNIKNSVSYKHMGNWKLVKEVCSLYNVV